MPRIVGIDIPNHKRVPIALTYIHGIGHTTAEAICKRMNFPPDMRAKDMTDEQVAQVATILDKEYVVEGALRRQVAQNIQRLKEIGCYRGIRHRRGLPVRGQQTQSNARTRKGPKKTVAGKKGVKAQK